MTQAKPLTEQQQENLQNYVIIQCNYIANELNKNSNSEWKIESIGWVMIVALLEVVFVVKEVHWLSPLKMATD